MCLVADPNREGQTAVVISAVVISAVVNSALVTLMVITAVVPIHLESARADAYQQGPPHPRPLSICRPAPGPTVLWTVGRVQGV